jgi:O-antigen ligase
MVGAFVSVVFFLLTQDFRHSIVWQEQGLSTVDDIIAPADQLQNSMLHRVVLAAIGLFASLMLVRTRLPLHINGLLGCVLVFFVLWTILSAAWADDTAMASRRLVAFVVVALLALAVAGRFSTGELMALAFVLCGVILVEGVFAEVALGTLHFSQDAYRFCGTDDPNVGSWGIATLLLTAVAFASTSHRHRGLFWAAALVALTFLLLGRTRTTTFAVTVALFAYWYLISSRRRRLGITLAIVLAVLCISAVGYLVLDSAPLPVIRNAALLGRDPTDATTLSGRIPVWVECMSYMRKRPLLGYGYGAFWTAQRVAEISSKAGWGNIAAASAMNSYIDLALSGGIIGAGALVLVFALAIVRARLLFRITHNPSYAFACSFLLFICIVMLTEGILSYPNISQFIALTILARLALFPARLTASG